MVCFFVFLIEIKDLKNEFAIFLISILKNFLILELPEPSTDLRALSFQVRKTYFCMLNIQHPT